MEYPNQVNKPFEFEDIFNKTARNIIDLIAFAKKENSHEMMCYANNIQRYEKLLEKYE